jgi:hypothetical protein
MADGLRYTGYDFRVGRTFNGFLFQPRQELFDFPFDLPSRSWPPLLIIGFKQASQLDHPSALPFQLSIRLRIVLADSRDIQQG